MVTMTASHEVRSSTGAAHAKNTADDVDNVYFSLQKFLKMACDGDTVAIDMLHCDDKNMMSGSPVWTAIVENRHLFYTKNMKAFLGYCRKQASKYGVKGTRLKAMEDVLTVLNKVLEENPDARMNDSADTEEQLKQVEATHPVRVAVKDGFYKGNKYVDKKIVEVCDGKYDFTTKVSYVVDALQKKYNAYGHRAQMAKEDWTTVFDVVSALEDAGF
jgi:cellulose synthase/poly-beta-1,6-N-acetylglucosamine synthase-like glycosyltransferase